MFDFDVSPFWQWMILSFALLSLEVVLPGVFLLWFGIAAMITAVVAFFMPEFINVQYAVFAITSIVVVIIANKYFGKKQNDNSTLNRRGEQYIGKKYLFKGGKVKVGDSWWLAEGEGEGLNDGDIVEVTDVDGTILKVKK